MAVADAPLRAPFASDPARSRGRLVPEPPSATRSAYRRDCDRVIHATAFRRLQFKTQVFVFHEGDHYRTRLTHSLEVAQIARAIARSLGVDEDLTEALALAHDLGHPPFGHAGERALDAAMAAYGGFDHNAQALRIVTHLERRYPDFDGLNLTWETLEGIVKHNGPVTAGAAGLPWALADYLAGHDLGIASRAGVEAQIAAIADDIAYNAHDIDDGLRAGLFSADDLISLPLVGDILKNIRALFPGLEPQREGAQLVRMMITHWIDDVLQASSARLAALQPKCVEDVRAHSAPIIAMSDEAADAQRNIKAFLFARMYRHPRVNKIMANAETVVRDLFGFFLKNPDALPDAWDTDAPESTAHARHVSDFIAGMTDRFALDMHRRFFDLTPDLR